MQVNILDNETKTEVASVISLVKDDKRKLPSVNDGWRFNFNKHARKPEFETYVLYTEQAENNIEGCLILNMKYPHHAYLAYIEVAPHNRGKNKNYDRVAGCLLAFACRRSFITGKEGFLAFDVLEENKKDEEKLMEHYSFTYGAVRLEKTSTMLILPEVSENLIVKFLE